MKIDLATIDGTSDTDIGLQDGDVVRSKPVILIQSV